MGNNRKMIGKVLTAICVNCGEKFAYLTTGTNPRKYCDSCVKSRDRERRRLAARRNRDMHAAPIASDAIKGLKKKVQFEDAKNPTAKEISTFTDYLIRKHEIATCTDADSVHRRALWLKQCLDRKSEPPVVVVKRDGYVIKRRGQFVGGCRRSLRLGLLEKKGY